jgi:hypothetical protein
MKLNEIKGQETNRTMKNEQQLQEIIDNDSKKFNDFHRVGIGIGLGNTDEQPIQLHYNNSMSTNDLSKLYPPGRILHSVRNYFKNTETETTTKTKKRKTLKTILNGLSKTKKQKNNNKLCYKITEANNEQFNEIIQDQMPNNILKTMKQVKNI